LQAAIYVESDIPPFFKSPSFQNFSKSTVPGGSSAAIGSFLEMSQNSIRHTIPAKADKVITAGRRKVTKQPCFIDNCHVNEQIQEIQ
jgi:hypothetical protein